MHGSRNRLSKQEKRISHAGRRLRLFYDGNFVLCFVPDHYRKSSTDLLCGRNFMGGSVSFLSVSIVIKTETPRSESGDFTIIITVLTAGSIAGFKIMGPSPLFFVAFAVIQAVIVFRAAEGLREKGKYRCLDGMMFVIVWLQITVYIVSVFIRDYTRFNLYFGVDITLTLMLAGMLPALRKEVGRE